MVIKSRTQSNSMSTVFSGIHMIAFFSVNRGIGKGPRVNNFLTSAKGCIIFKMNCLKTPNLKEIFLVF